MLDVRKPIGYLFTIIGALLTVYAIGWPQMTTLVVEDGPTYVFNLNLPCGISMLVFGVLMLGLARLDVAKKKAQATEPTHG
jgi:hypothetical protein